jgi:hypothetical protein
MNKDDPPLCNMGAIAFPTDAITLGVMRRREPHLFTQRGLDEDSPAHCDAMSTLWIELRVAEKAFAKSAGLPDPDPDTPRTALVQDLDKAYVEYGLSTGMAQTRELVRGFEAAAAEQASRFRPRGR